MSPQLSTLLAFYRRRSLLGYWIWAALAVVAGMIVGETLSEDLAWMGLRYRIYSFFQSLGPRPPTPKWTALVLVDDDEYWRGELARRSPIHRDYLARLLAATAACHPIAVGIDFNLSSPAPDLPENSQYEEETELLKREILRVSASFPVVLPVTLLPDKSGFGPSVLDSVPSREHGIVRGFITMPHDFRHVATSERLGRSTEVPSFALALVDQAHPRIARRYKGHPRNFPFGTFAPEAAFRQYTLSSSDLLRGGPEVCRTIDHKLVILGGGWHRDGYGQDDLIDTHDSTLGTVGKYLMHANYVESMLEERTYVALGKNASRAVELFFALIVLHVLASAWPLVAKLAVVLGTTGVLALVTYFGLQNLGVFGDFLFPAFFLGVHAIVDYIWDLVVISKKYCRRPAYSVAAG